MAGKGRDKSPKQSGRQRRKTGRQHGYARLAVAAASALVVALLVSGGLYVLAERAERAPAPEVASTAPGIDPAPAPTRGDPTRGEPPARDKAAREQASQPDVSVPPRSAPRTDVGVNPLAPPPAPRQAWRRNGVAVAPAPGAPRIAIVIDDMGVDQGRSRRAAALPAPLTLAYLGYARDLGDQTAQARAAGHELMVHLPMEPDGAAADPGPNALLTGLEPAEFARRLEWNLAQFDGYVGVNNHMGSRLTRDRALMAPVMTRLRRDGYLFLDSRTSGDSVAADVARATGVPTASRDVFLDHVATAEAVTAALRQTEEIARREGSAIAIGHPKDVTLDALEAWLPDVRARGFALVPVSALVDPGERTKPATVAHDIN